MEQPGKRENEKQEYARYLKILGAQIRAMRKERGWTLRDMVVQHGFHLSAWQGYEAGRLGISLPSLLRVARALGLPASKLLERIEIEQASTQNETEPRKPASEVTRKGASRAGRS